MSSLSCLPSHGAVECARCHKGQPYSFGKTITEVEGWRITNNPLSWGSMSPEVVALGFSKGPTAMNAIRKDLHNDIPYRKGRTNVAKIFHHVGLIDAPDRAIVDAAIADPNGRFHFGSLVRCSVEQFDGEGWISSGGDMLGRFIATDFGKSVVTSCASRFLADLPGSVKLVVMFGLGSRGSYVHACRSVYETVRPGIWRAINDVSYGDGRIVVVHVEHFSSQGANIPNWLGQNDHERSRLGRMAREGVEFALAKQPTIVRHSD